MELSREVRFSLPPHVNVHRVSYHVKLPSGLQSPMGETHLLAHHGRLVVLTRSKMSDALQAVGMSAEKRPRLLHEEWQDVLLLRGEDNQRYRIPLSNSVVGPVAFLLEETKDAPPETVDGAHATEATDSEATTGEPSPGTQDDPDPGDPSMPIFETSEPTPDVEIVPTDPDSVLDGVAEYLGAGRLSLAASWARTVPEMSLYHAPEAQEAIGVVEALAGGHPGEAFLRAELADFLRVGIHDGALRPAADAFAQRGEMVWAAAALSAALGSVDEVRVSQAFRQLGKDAARDEHHDWLLSELDRQRADLFSQRILETRTTPVWRELRARQASRRGGHALALRELKLLSDRFGGLASIEAARLRALWDSHQRPLFDRLVERCTKDFADDPPGLMHVTRVAAMLGASSAQLRPMVARLVELAPADPVLRTWQADLGQASGSHPGIWVAVGAGGALLAAALALLA